MTNILPLNQHGAVVRALAAIKPDDKFVVTQSEGEVSFDVQVGRLKEALFSDVFPGEVADLIAEFLQHGFATYMDGLEAAGVKKMPEPDTFTFSYVVRSDEGFQHNVSVWDKGGDECIVVGFSANPDHTLVSTMPADMETETFALRFKEMVTGIAPAADSAPKQAAPDTSPEPAVPQTRAERGGGQIRRLLRSLGLK